MGVSAGLLASCEKAGIEPGRDYDLQRAARDRLDRLAAGAGELPLGLRARAARTSGCSRPAAAPTCARRSSPAARCCPCTRANCSAARSAARWRPGTSRAAASSTRSASSSSPSRCPRCRCSSGAMRTASGCARATSRCTRASGATATGSASPPAAARSSTGARTRRSTARACAWAPARSTGRRARVEEVLDALVVDIPGAGAETVELRMVLFVVLREGVDARRRAHRADQAAHPRGLLAAARAQRDPADRRGAAHAVGQGARGAGQAHPHGRRRRSEAASVDSLANPRSLDYFVRCRRARSQARLGQPARRPAHSPARGRAIASATAPSSGRRSPS